MSILIRRSVLGAIQRYKTMQSDFATNHGLAERKWKDEPQRFVLSDPQWGLNPSDIQGSTTMGRMRSAISMVTELLNNENA